MGPFAAGVIAAATTHSLTLHHTISTVGISSLSTTIIIDIIISSGRMNVHLAIGHSVATRIIIGMESTAITLDTLGAAGITFLAMAAHLLQG